jgi:hypothetical protein
MTVLKVRPWCFGHWHMSIGADSSRVPGTDYRPTCLAAPSLWQHCGLTAQVAATLVFAVGGLPELGTSRNAQEEHELDGCQQSLGYGCRGQGDNRSTAREHGQQ